SAQAAGLPCQPCAGIRLAAPLFVPPPAAPGAAAAPGTSGLLGLLRAERLPPGSPLFIAWEVPLAAAAIPAAAGTGPSAQPPTPLARNLAQLQAELTAAAEVAAASPRGTWFQIVWRPAAAGPGAAGAAGAGAGAGAGVGAAAAGSHSFASFAAADYAFLLKR